MTKPKLACPYCGYPESAVVDSRPFLRRDGVFRRRECGKCGKRFSTEEVVKPVFPSGAAKKSATS